MKKLLQGLAATGFLVATVAATAFMPLQPVGAINTKEAISDGVQGAGGGEPNSVAFNRALQNIVNILLFIIGAVAVIMIVIGGIKYTTSNGDSTAISSAKNTILYSVVGLVIALLAYAIVNFVINQF